MFPNSTAAWVFILVTFITSYLVGRWIRSRRKKDNIHDEYIDGLRRRVLAEKQVQAKKGKKTKKKKNKQNSAM